MAIVAIALAVAVPGSVCARNAKLDPATKRVRILYVGDTLYRTWRDLAFDPFLSVQPVPATIGHFQTGFIRKSMRMYLPRTYDDHAGKFDLTVLSDTDRFLFTTDQQQMFKRGVLEMGQGMIMAGGFEAFGGAGWGSSWRGSSVEDVLPVECVDAQSWSSPFKASPFEGWEDHPFVTSLPWRTSPPFDGMNVVIAKQGSVLLLEARGMGISAYEHRPVIVYGEYGKGASLAHTPDWNPGWGSTVMNDWEYYGDYLINMAYLVAAVPIPQEIQLSHMVRAQLAGYYLHRTVTISLLEFAEKFGAKVARLEEDLNEIELLKAEADGHYLDQEYEEGLSVTDRINALFTEINSEAVKLKDQALHWVYVVEWASVTATSLLCGFALWTLMVRRRLYGEVETTRLRSHWQ